MSKKIKISGGRIIQEFWMVVAISLRQGLYSRINIGIDLDRWLGVKG